MPFDYRTIRDRTAGPPVDPADASHVISVGDGIARVSGLCDAMAGEQPLDGKGPIATFMRAPIERMAPALSIASASASHCRQG